MPYLKVVRFLVVFFLVAYWFLSYVPSVQAAAVATPTFSLTGGSYTGIQTTTITTTTGGATICYTTDGSTPVGTSGTCDLPPTQTYTGALTIDRSQTIKAIGTKNKSTNSSVASSTYTITVDTPTFGTNGGSFYNDASSTISDAFTGATICYTTDGFVPGVTGGICNTDGHTQTYTGAVPITATGTVIKAVGVKSGSVASALATSNAFTLTVGAITSSPGAGTYGTTQSVSLNVATTSGAVAHYTTDGSAVSCLSTTYSTAINVAATTAVKAIGCKTNYVSDTAISDLYTIAAVSISITSNGLISYGAIPASTSKNTTASSLNNTQTAKNDSLINENFNIKTSNATGGTQWTLGATPGSDIFVHEFSINSGTNWTAFTTPDSYQTLATGIAAAASQNFDLRLTAPSSSSDYLQKTITITIQATAQ